MPLLYYFYNENKDSRFKAAWKRGSTRTIRVPIALADATLDYARQLDKGVEPRDTQGKTTTQDDDPVEAASSEPCDTADDIISPETRVNTTQSHDTRKLSDEVAWLKAENKRLQNALDNSEQERADQDANKKSAPGVQVSLDAADVYNQFKAHNKKSKASLADIEALLELLVV